MGRRACFRTQVRPSISMWAVCGSSQRLRSKPAVEPSSRRIAICARSPSNSAGTLRTSSVSADHGRRQEPLPLPAREGGEGTLQFLQIVRGKTEAAQNGLLGFRGGGVVMAPDIPKTGIDSETRSGAIEKLLECLGHEE